MTNRRVSGFFIILLIMMFLSNFYYRGGESFSTWIVEELLIIPGIIIGISFHEFGHAFVAYKLGDSTPKMQGRVTLNPKAHLDPYGFLWLILAGFGWGAPVQVDKRNFKHPRAGMVLVSLAGVIMNFILAIAFMFVLKLVIYVAYPSIIAGTGIGSIIYDIVLRIVQINLVLMVFNLLPIPPLDGSSIFAFLMPEKYLPQYYKVQQWALPIFMIVVILLPQIIGFNPIGWYLNATAGSLLDLLL